MTASLGGGWLADRWHPRGTVSAGLLGLTGALVMIGIVVRVSVPLTLVALAVMALAAYPVFPAQQAELLRVFPAAESGRILAWNQSAMYVGIAAGSVFGGSVMSGPGFRYLPLICAAAALAGFAASLFATRTPASRAPLGRPAACGFIGSSASVAGMFGAGIVPVRGEGVWRR